MDNFAEDLEEQTQKQLEEKQGEEEQAEEIATEEENSNLTTAKYISAIEHLIEETLEGLPNYIQLAILSNVGRKKQLEEQQRLAKLGLFQSPGVQY